MGRWAQQARRGSTRQAPGVEPPSVIIEEVDDRPGNSVRLILQTTIDPQIFLGDELEIQVGITFFPGDAATRVDALTWDFDSVSWATVGGGEAWRVLHGPPNLVVPQTGTVL